MYATQRVVTLWGDEIDSNTTQKIRDEVAEFLAEDQEDWITLEIFSPGGDWIPGQALYQWLRTNVPKLQTVSYSLVASMAVPLFLAGDHRVVTPGTFFVLHPTLDDYDGPIQMDVDAYRNSAKSLEFTQKRYNKILLDRMEHPPTKKELEKTIKRVTAIGTKRALKWGLAHELKKS